MSAVMNLHHDKCPDCPQSIIWYDLIGLEQKFAYPAWIVHSVHVKPFEIKHITNPWHDGKFWFIFSLVNTTINSRVKLFKTQDMMNIDHMMIFHQIYLKNKLLSFKRLMIPWLPTSLVSVENRNHSKRRLSSIEECVWCQINWKDININISWNITGRDVWYQLKWISIERISIETDISWIETDIILLNCCLDCL